jgi:hypothetical protein
MFVAGSSRGDDKIEADFSKLLTIAERYDLPQPPKEAALVLANTGWTSIIGNSSTSHDPGIYQPAFVLEKYRNRRRACSWAGPKRTSLPASSITLQLDPIR